MAVSSATPLSNMEVFVVDCQATAAAPRGRLLEMGWARAGATLSDTHAYLIRIPDGERVPPAVARITGITEHIARTGIDACAAWRRLCEAAAPHAPAPAVIHFARFERPFLDALAAGSTPLDIVCTHEIARRLLPALPRRSLRALAGYFGRAVGPLRRSADHVEATAFVWRELVRLLDAEGITTWPALHHWLDEPVTLAHRVRRVWPMPRAVRLSLPDAPGIYRMLRTSGDVLYVGKASSLHHRVNSYFRHQSGVHERLLEMLSQARGLSFEVTPTALEAALLEPDEIKRHRPPYNIALADDDRALWFTPRDMSTRTRRPTPHFALGPFPSPELLDQFAALADGRRSALGRGRWAPEPTVFRAGYERFRAAHHELSDGVGEGSGASAATADTPSARTPGTRWAGRRSAPTLGRHAALLRLGTRLWRDGRRDRDDDGDLLAGRRVPAWSPESVQAALERLALRAALARRRALWFTRMTDVAIVWIEPEEHAARLIVVENGDIIECAGTASIPPVPPGHERSLAARREAFTLARYDRLRVLTTELKRLVAGRSPVSIRFGKASLLDGDRLVAALAWV